MVFKIYSRLWTLGDQISNGVEYFKWFPKFAPFDNLTQIHYLNTGQVRYSDIHLYGTVHEAKRVLGTKHKICNFFVSTSALIPQISTGIGKTSIAVTVTQG